MSITSVFFFFYYSFTPVPETLDIPSEIRSGFLEGRILCEGGIV